MSRTDHSGRDAKATLGVCGAVTLKKGLPPELCSRYWRDAHGTLAARGAEWIVQYRQHHLGRCEGGFWQPAAGITYDCPGEDQIDGLAETTFASEQARKGYGGSRLYAALIDDERYCFDRSVMYRTASDGRYEFETVIPAGYKVPGTGRAGRCLSSSGGTSGGRPTSTSSSARGATLRSPR